LWRRVGCGVVRKIAVRPRGIIHGPSTHAACGGLLRTRGGRPGAAMRGRRRAVRARGAWAGPLGRPHEYSQGALLAHGPEFNAAAPAAPPRTAAIGRASKGSTTPVRAAPGWGADCGREGACRSSRGPPTGDHVATGTGPHQAGHLRPHPGTRTHPLTGSRPQKPPCLPTLPAPRNPPPSAACRLPPPPPAGALFDAGEAGEWDALFAGHPCVVAAGPRDMRMFYHSWDASKGRWGRIWGGGPRCCRMGVVGVVGGRAGECGGGLLRTSFGLGAFGVNWAGWFFRVGL
jgi:hypothetical protein